MRDIVKKILRNIPIKMKEWEDELDRFLDFNGKNILTNFGNGQ